MTTTASADIRDSPIVDKYGHPIPYKSLKADDVMSAMEQGAELPNGYQKYKGDLGETPRVGGFCPTMIDRLWKFPYAAVGRCIKPEVSATLKTCKVFVGEKIGAGTMSDAADCLSKLAAKMDFSKPLDRVTQALPEAVACMARSIVDISQGSPEEKRTRIAVIDGVKAGYDEFQKLSTLAANLATMGPGAIPDFLAIDASGNDGDNTSLSVADWLIEADKIAKDPRKYARSQTAAKLETSITAALANALMNPTQTLEGLRNRWDPDRPLGGTNEMLRQCKLTDAQVVWAARRAALEATIADARISMEYYRRQTYCELTMGARDFDGEMSPPEKRTLIEGSSGGLLDPRLDRPVATGFQKWQRYVRNFNRALKAYDEFRKKEADFQSAYRPRAEALKPLLKEAEELRQLARANMRICTGGFPAQSTIDAKWTGDGVDKELRWRARELKSRIFGMGCSDEIADSVIDPIESEIDNPSKKWADFLASADLRILMGEVCSASAAEALNADFHKAVSESFGSIPAMQSCLKTEEEKRKVAFVLESVSKLDSLDDAIANAAKLVETCDQSAAESAIARANALLDTSFCAQNTGPGSHNDRLDALSRQLASYCAESAGIERKTPDEVSRLPGPRPFTGWRCWLWADTCVRCPDGYSIIGADPHNMKCEKRGNPSSRR
jgi:hypothetical protein